MKRRRGLARSCTLGLLAALLIGSSPGPATAVGAGQDLLRLASSAAQVPSPMPPAKKKPIKIRKVLKTVELSAAKATKVEAAPELDPSAVGSAAVLLLGGMLVAVGRRGREDPRLGEESARGPIS